MIIRKSDFDTLMLIRMKRTRRKNELTLYHKYSLIIINSFCLSKKYLQYFIFYKRHFSSCDISLPNFDFLYQLDLKVYIIEYLNANNSLLRFYIPSPLYKHVWYSKPILTFLPVHKTVTHVCSHLNVKLTLFLQQ